MVRVFAIVVGVALAAAGGVVAYRAAFLAPRAALVITDTSARELPDVPRVAGGLALLVAGALLAFFAARRPRA